MKYRRRKKSFLCTSLSLAGNWGCLTRVRLSSRRGSATHSYQCVQYFACPNNGMAASIKTTGIFNVCTFVEAYNCTRRLYGHLNRVDLHWELTLGEKIPCGTGDSNPRQYILRLAFQSDALPTELSPTDRLLDRKKRDR